MLLCCLVLSFPPYHFATPHSRIIYGLDQAKNFKDPLNGRYYIQLGSFSSQENAAKFKRTVHVAHPNQILIQKHSPYYHVVFGPFSSANQVRAAANQATLKAEPNRIYRQPVSTHTVVNPRRAAYQTQRPTKKVASTNHSNLSTRPTQLKSPFEMKATQENWQLMVNVGGQFPLVKNTMTVNNASLFPPPHDQDVYSTHSNHSQAIVGAELGRRWQLEPNPLWLQAFSAGIMYQYFFPINLGNTIEQYSVPQFTNYNYKWNFSSNTVLATGKLNFQLYDRVSPFIHGGVGAAFNHTNHFSETPLANVTPRISPSFSSNTTAQLAYNVGAGLDYAVKPHFLVFLGYQYENLGKVNSGPGTQTWAAQTLNLGTYQTNSIFAGVNYLFPNKQ